MPIISRGFLIRNLQLISFPAKSVWITILKRSDLSGLNCSKTSELACTTCRNIGLSWRYWGLQMEWVLPWRNLGKLLKRNPWQCCQRSTQQWRMPTLSLRRLTQLLLRFLSFAVKLLTYFGVDLQLVEQFAGRGERIENIIPGDIYIKNFQFTLSLVRGSAGAWKKGIKQTYQNVIVGSQKTTTMLNMKVTLSISYAWSLTSPSRLPKDVEPVMSSTGTTLMNLGCSLSKSILLSMKMMFCRCYLH